MILLNSVGGGSYGPFFLDGGNLEFAFTCTMTSAAPPISGSVNDEFGVPLATFSIPSQSGSVSVAQKVIAPSGAWNFTVDSYVTLGTLTVRRIPE